MLFTLADAAVALDGGAGSSDSATAAAAQKSGGWFGFISDAMEVVLKVGKRSSNFSETRRIFVEYLRGNFNTIYIARIAL